MTASAVKEGTTGDRRFAALPHFRGAVLPAAKLDTIAEETRGLARLVQGEKVFLLTSQAGFYYLVSVIRNPTPFDYPLATNLGTDGQDGIVRLIRGGKIRWVCMRSYSDPALNPSRLEHWIERNMDPVESVGFCDLFRRRPRSPGPG